MPYPTGRTSNSLSSASFTQLLITAVTLGFNHDSQGLEDLLSLMRAGPWRFSFLGAVIAVVVAVFLIAALVSPIANFTTGITIAHTGFTPNPNVTASPGAVPLLQLYTFLFVVLGLVVIYRYAEAEMPRGGL